MTLLELLSVELNGLIQNRIERSGMLLRLSSLLAESIYLCYEPISLRLDLFERLKTIYKQILLIKAK